MRSVTVLAAALVGVGVYAWAQEKQGRQDVDTTPVKKDLVEKVLAGWPEKAAESGRKVIERYGLPHELSSSRMIWNRVGPWREIIAWRYEVEHKFPKPHHDFVESVVDYKVPPDKFDELAEYDGSIIAERTRGTMSARCHNEAMNFLAINLAHDVVEGRKSVEEARQDYARLAKAFMGGEKPDYTQRLMFEVRKENTGDPDEAVLKEAK